MTEGSFHARLPQPGDQIVCGACAATIGYRTQMMSALDSAADAAKLTAAALAALQEAHQPDCKRRLAVQLAARTNSGIPPGRVM